VAIWRVDGTHGNAIRAFDAMGRPPGDLSREQIRQLQAAAALAPPEHVALVRNRLDITVPVHGLALLIIGASPVPGPPAAD
jgi:xylan 1,4-beta-xylosidase